MLPVEVRGDLDTELGSGGPRKMSWAVFPVTCDQGPLVTLLSAYFMGTAT